MEEEKKRDWEKGTAAPIPDNKYEKFKEELKEYSKKYSDRNFTLFMLARATGYRRREELVQDISQFMYLIK